MGNAGRGGTRMDRLVGADFTRARRSAILKGFIALLLNRPIRLLSFHEVQGSLRAKEEVYLGICAVEVSKIVGSVNRHQDFDRFFLPIRASCAERVRLADGARVPLVESERSRRSPAAHLAPSLSITETPIRRPAGSPGRSEPARGRPRPPATTPD